ncbi:hypothetical protein CcCBS67573_g03309 [Chytriomyces confervae]|uniref:Crinkler effector protein N-terminal domain-containing protein n=1 Tax=Chytriomyces confervae TaxID=246404 RepID=A0A507FGX7_9FUNG|nr:hypothetical protein CcCBS67573_g03309 [Chytriomyces confervae]
MVKVFCALVSNDKFQSLSVTVNATDPTVDDLKEAILTKKRNALGHLDADNLILLRVCKKVDKSGGLSDHDLKSWPECFTLDAYGNEPETAMEANLTMFAGVQGASLVKGDLLSKVVHNSPGDVVMVSSFSVPQVMHPKNDLSAYFDETAPPKKGFNHVVILLPAEIELGPSHRNDMDIDPPVFHSTYAESYLKNTLETLASFIRLKRNGRNERNVFSAKDSLQDIQCASPLNVPAHSTSATQMDSTIEGAAEPAFLTNQRKSILKLEMKQSHGTSSLFTSDQIYQDEKDVGINMPVDKLLDVKEQTIILLGTSGCGKTRTCYDFARHQFCLYFDCTADADVNAMIDKIQDNRPDIKSPQNQQKFEVFSRKALKCLIASRMLLLRMWRQENEASFEWFCVQRSRRTGLVLAMVFQKLIEYPLEVVDMVYYQFLEELSDCWVIFDESQYFLSILQSDYRSSHPDNHGISENKLEHPRSFFSFATGFIIRQNLKSIWCGTQMRIQNIDVICSAAGLKPEKCFTFSKFNFLTPSDIFKLCLKWLQADAFNSNETLLDEISMFLQGRPRFFMMFLHKLHKLQDISQAYSVYRTEMTTNEASRQSSEQLEKSSPYCFWQSRISWEVAPFEGSNSLDAKKKYRVAHILLELCVSFLFGDGLTMKLDKDLDMLATNLVMLVDQEGGWGINMPEPLILIAGINFLVDQDQYALINFLSSDYFSPLVSAAQRGQKLELIIAVRFLQGWWLTSEMREFLPKWVNDLNIPKPRGFLDCRKGDEKGNHFIQQLRNPGYPFLLMPSENAGPDLRYSVFSCCVKTTSTAKSKSTMHVSSRACRDNTKFIYPQNWYTRQQDVNAKIKEELQSPCRFVHIRFEIPGTAPNFVFEPDATRDDHVICVTLESEFAEKFFGEVFVTKYKEFVSSVIREASAN